MRYIVKSIVTIMIITGLYCVHKPHQEKPVDPFADLTAICKESDDGGLCFCCNSYSDACSTANFASFWQMTCDQAYQMQFKIIRKGQRQ